MCISIEIDCDVKSDYMWIHGGVYIHMWRSVNGTPRHFKRGIRGVAPSWMREPDPIMFVPR